MTGQGTAQRRSAVFIGERDTFPFPYPAFPVVFTPCGDGAVTLSCGNTLSIFCVALTRMFTRVSLLGPVALVAVHICLHGENALPVSGAARSPGFTELSTLAIGIMGDDTLSVSRRTVAEVAAPKRVTAVGGRDRHTATVHKAAITAQFAVSQVLAIWRLLFLAGQEYADQ